MGELLNFNIRKATQSDAHDLAKLIDIAGEGIPSWLWAKSCDEGQTALDVGAARAQRVSGGFSHNNAMIYTQDSHILGMVLSYPIETKLEDNPDDLPAPIAPFVELEHKSIGTWYINALAVFPGHRGAGIGSTLLEMAEAAAFEAGFQKVSIQVYAQNTGAVRLYQRSGFEMSARAKVRLHPCQPYYSGDVALLIKTLI